MAESTATTESRAEDPDHREVFVMGYHLDEPRVLQAWDTELESKSFETQCKVYMVDHTAGGTTGLNASNTGGETPALRPEENPRCFKTTPTSPAPS